MDENRHATALQDPFFRACKAIPCPPTFDFEALLQKSTARESMPRFGKAHEDLKAHNAAEMHNSAGDYKAADEHEITDGHEAADEHEATDEQGAAGLHDASEGHEGMQAEPHQTPFTPMPPNAFTTSAVQPGHGVKKNASYRKKLSRARRKRTNAEKLIKEGRALREKVLKRHVNPATPFATSVDSATFPVTAGAYTAKSAKPTRAQVPCTKDELVNSGFKLITTEGPIIDEKNRIIGVVIRPLQDPGFQEAIIAAADIMTKEGERARLNENVTPHHRGRFAAINSGVTHGVGTLKPVNLDNKHNTDMVNRLLTSTSFQRLAGFADACFKIWAPNVYAYYRSHLNQLHEKMPHLRRIFPGSVYPAAAFNFGPNAWTHPHRDTLNLPFGWCSIQALGDFDYKKGGHLVLWELRMVIEFPPGTLILIPSATITHSNVPIAEGETRHSFTQYAAGGLFRYVDYGFRLEKDVIKKDPDLWEEICRRRPDRWRIGLKLLSTLEELKGNATT